MCSNHEEKMGFDYGNLSHEYTHIQKCQLGGFQHANKIYSTVDAITRTLRRKSDSLIQKDQNGYSAGN